MQKYEVTITVKTEKKVLVYADDELYAIHKAEEKNRRGDYNIYDSRFIGWEYQTENFVKEALI